MARARQTATSPKGSWTQSHSLAIAVITVFCLGTPFWPGFMANVLWLTLMMAMALFVLVVGHGVTGAWTGAIIDDRCKMSLSRLQMLVWTIVTLSAYAVFVTVRMRHDAATALDVGVPTTIWTLLAISSTSLVGSPLIKNTQKAAAAPSAEHLHTYLAVQGTSPENLSWQGTVVTNGSVAEASPADLFRGEYVNNFTLLDLGKIQLFFFTTLLILEYCVSIGHVLTHEAYPASLPDIGSGILPLFGVSHTGYLMNKVVTSPLMSTPDTDERVKHG